jgi:hypothetical protein
MVFPLFIGGFFHVKSIVSHVFGCTFFTKYGVDVDAHKYVYTLTPMNVHITYPYEQFRETEFKKLIRRVATLTKSPQVSRCRWKYRLLLKVYRPSNHMLILGRFVRCSFFCLLPLLLSSGGIQIDHYLSSQVSSSNKIER